MALVGFVTVSERKSVIITLFVLDFAIVELFYRRSACQFLSDSLLFFGAAVGISEVKSA
jgi:hypothetical protein